MEQDILYMQQIADKLEAQRAKEQEERNRPKSGVCQIAEGVAKKNQRKKQLQEQESRFTEKWITMQLQMETLEKVNEELQDRLIVQQTHIESLEEKLERLMAQPFERDQLSDDEYWNLYQN